MLVYEEKPFSQDCVDNKVHWIYTPSKKGVDDDTKSNIVTSQTLETIAIDARFWYRYLVNGNCGDCWPRSLQLDGGLVVAGLSNSLTYE